MRFFCFGLFCSVQVIFFTCPAIAATEPLFLECNIKGISFDSKFQETIGIKIHNGMIDVISEEFSMFGPVEESDISFKVTKRFTSNKGVKYFFSVELDRLSGRFMAYETAAYPNRKIYNTRGTGPCAKVPAQRFFNLKPEQKKNQPIKIIIRSPTN